jgi:hypothetical protein
VSSRVAFGRWAGCWLSILLLTDLAATLFRKIYKKTFWCTNPPCAVLLLLLLLFYPLIPLAAAASCPRCCSESRQHSHHRHIRTLTDDSYSAVAAAVSLLFPLCNLSQLLPAVLAAAAEAGSTPIIVTSGPSATPGASKPKPSGGLFAFAPKLGSGSKGRAAAIAEKAGVESYVVVTAAGLNAGGEEATSQNLVLAEAGTVDPATAGGDEWQWFSGAEV